jgi:hypothetical protein
VNVHQLPLLTQSGIECFRVTPGSKTSSRLIAYVLKSAIRYVFLISITEEINDQARTAAAHPATRARNQIGSNSYRNDISTAKTMIPIAILTSCPLVISYTWMFPLAGDVFLYRVVPRAKPCQ